MFLGNENEFYTHGICSRTKMNKKAGEWLKQYGLSHIDPSEEVSLYDFEERKMLELLKAMYNKPRLLIVDETTTALSHTGRDVLYQMISDLKNRGGSVIFISHDLDEILEHCTILTVLRDGEIRGVISREEMQKEDSISRIRQLMVGRDIGDQFYRSDYDASHGAQVALEYRNVSNEKIKEFSLELR